MAIIAIGPAVIGADKGFAITAGLFTNPGSAVATDIVHSTDLALIVAADNDRVLAYIEQEVVTIFSDLTDMPGIQPALKNNML